MEDNNTTELRQTLVSYLDTLQRNLAVVSLEILKTKYKKPFNDLCQKIRLSASAYVKQVALKDIRIHSKYLAETVPLIESAIRQSGILPMVTAAAFRRQDITEIDTLASELKIYILEALEPFFARHMGLYVSKECLADPERQPELYNDVTGCVLLDGIWVPLPHQNNLLFLTIKEKTNSAA